jgi:hypothetical protein
MNRVTLNGKTYESEGGNIVVENGRVFINGKDVSGEQYGGILTIKFEGTTLASLSVDNGNVECQDVGGNVKAGGSVKAVGIGGSVKAGGSVHAEKIGGDAFAGGSVNAGTVKGQADAGGTVHIDGITINA